MVQTFGAPSISIIIPLLNEEEVFDDLIKAIDEATSSLDYSIEVILIDDGSTDRTRANIEAIVQKDKRYRGICFSRNFGHQAAITAGLESANCTKAAFIIDGDLQDPPSMLQAFVSKMDEGYDVVYGIRKSRSRSWAKNRLYRFYYRVLRSVSHLDMPLDSGDFALLSRRALDAINRMPERNRYVRGLRAFVGFRQIGISYDRPERELGNSKYSWSKLFQLAFNGIFNFSRLPIRIITALGFVTFLVALVYLMYNIVKKYFFGTVPEGFTATLLVIVMFAGVQLIALGLIGEYVLRIFFEVKNRPLYVIEEEIHPKN